MTRSISGCGVKLLAATAAVMIAALTLSSATPARSEDPSIRVLFLNVASGTAAKALQDRVFDELRLVLDDGTIERVMAPLPAFASLPTAQQISHVRQVLTDRGAAASLWLDASANDRLILVIASASVGRGATRQLEVERRAGWSSALALAAKEELLALVAQAPSSTERETPRIVVVPVPRPKSARTPIVTVAPTVVVGLVGQQGPATLFGGRVDLDVRLRGALYGRLSVSATRGPTQSSHWGRIDGWQVVPGAQAVVAYPVGTPTMGLVATLAAGLGACVSSARMRPRATSSTSFGVIEACGLTGGELRWRPGTNTTLSLGVGLSGHTRPATYRRASDRGVVMTTPWLDLNATL